MYKLFAIATLTLFFYNHAFGYKNYTTSNGLVNNVVYNVYKDSKGYLWFGTSGGISRYDGKHFKNYTTLDGISDNDVFNFYEDNTGRLWLFTYNGSLCYIRNDSVFNKFNNTILKNTPSISFVRTMINSGDSSLYIGYNYGTIIKIKGNDYKFVIRNDTKYTEISALRYRDGLLEVASYNALVCMRDNGTVIKRTKINRNASFVFADGILSAQDSRIIIYKNGINIWEYKDNSILKNDIISLSCFRNNIFCCTKQGFFIIDIKTKEKRWFLKNIPITGACIDLYGNYWISSLGHGVFSFKNEYRNIKLIGKETENHVIKSANGQIFDVQGHKVFFLKDNCAAERIHVVFQKNFVPLCQTDSFFIYNTSYATCIYNKFTGKSFDLAPSIFKACFAASSNDFVLSNGYNVYKYSVNANTIKRPFCILNEKILSIKFFDSNRCFYLLTNTKLYTCDFLTGSLKIADSFSATQMPVNMFLLSNNLVIETNANSFIVYNISSKFMKYGLINTINRIFYNVESTGIDKYIGYANTGYYNIHLIEKGIFKITFSKIEYPFNESEITELHSFGNSILCNADGNLYVFNNSLINKKIVKPQIFVDNVIVNDIKVTQNIIVKDALSCNILIKLNSLYFNDPGIAFRYRIKTEEGVCQWVNSNSGELNILLPKFNTYDIEAQAVSEGNILSDIKHIYVNWLPPFYLTWWFKAFIILLLMLLFSYGFYLFFRKKRQSFENELKYLQLEFKAINSLINPHFIFNAINNIQNLINHRDPDEASEYLATLSRLIRQNINNLQFNLIPLKKELTLIENYIKLQNLRFNGKVHLVIVDNGLDDNIYIPPLLIHTFVENAIVHAFRPQQNDFQITINMKLDGDYLFITVTDNGVGIKAKHIMEKAAGNKTSLGLDFTYRRIKRLSGYYKVQYSLDIVDRGSLDSSGTQVSIMIFSRFKEFLSD